MARGVRPEDRAAWEQRGGRIRFDAKGRPVYVIRKQEGGRRYEISTRKHTLAAALAEWEKFEKNPAVYASDIGPVYLDADLAAEFLKWSAAPPPAGAGNTARWVGQQKLYLAWWAGHLKGLDLRRVSLELHIRPALKGATSLSQRIATIKKLYGWLRTRSVGAIATAEDPTFGKLMVPQSRPEQARRRKAIPKEHIALVIEHLATDRWRDLLRVLAGTGMHVSELERFAEGGSLEPLPRDGRAEGAAGVVVIDRTKAGGPLRVAVSSEVLDAAKRVLKAGAFDRQKLSKAIHAACDVVKRPDGEIGIQRFGPGQLRHSIATLAVDSGATIGQVAAFLGHRSPRTTAKFYATHATPAKVRTVL